ncbi:MAG TPA: hypothetical protein VGB85_20925 [Nannocystis sp.]|jgi:hypothetical protein
MSLNSRVLKVAALAAVVLIPAVAHADTYGIAGTVISLTINESSADNYLGERGSLILSEGGVPRKYQWGGTACNGRNVTEANVALLFRAMEHGDRMTVLPSYKAGAGQARCLVGFTFTPVMTP